MTPADPVCTHLTWLDIINMQHNILTCHLAKHHQHFRFTRCRDRYRLQYELLIVKGKLDRRDRRLGLGAKTFN